ncbi:MAG: hypothetical protein ABI068_17310 [Ktedonobacterales bacterium]
MAAQPGADGPRSIFPIPLCARTTPCTASDDQSQGDNILLLDDGSLLAAMLYSPIVKGLAQPGAGSSLFRLASCGARPCLPSGIPSPAGMLPG